MLEDAEVCKNNGRFFTQLRRNKMFKSIEFFKGKSSGAEYGLLRCYTHCNDVFNNTPHSALSRHSLPQGARECGRSMIEMLGVLAIITVLSIVVQKVTRRKSLLVTFYQPIFCVFSFSYSRLK